MSEDDAGDGPTIAQRKVWKQDPDGVRANILAVARETFAASGLSGTRIEDIASRTATSKRMIYYYFGDKEGLYRAVLEDTYALMRHAEDQLNSDVARPGRRLAATGRVHIRSSSEHGELRPLGDDRECPSCPAHGTVRHHCRRELLRNSPPRGHLRARVSGWHVPGGADGPRSALAHFGAMLFQCLEPRNLLTYLRDGTLRARRTRAASPTGRRCNRSASSSQVRLAPVSKNRCSSFLAWRPRLASRPPRKFTTFSVRVRPGRASVPCT